MSELMTRWDAPRTRVRRVSDGLGPLVRGAVLLLLALPVGVAAQDAKETLFWDSVVCEREGEVRAYLRVYPNGAYVNEAQQCLEQQLGLDRTARILVQQGLASLDYAPGPADGQFGPATRQAMRAWQEAKGFAATGYLTREQADTLLAAGRDALAATERQRQAEEERRAEAERQRAEAARAEAERQQQAEAERRRKAEEEQRRAARPRELRNSIGMEFVLVEPGTFEMGSPATEPGRDDDETLHRVTLSQPYYLGKYEVTQGQWAAVMGSNPSSFSNCGRNCPVEAVSWEDAQGFIEELNLREGVAVYRLPTEAEWEYAARRGTQTAYHFGNAANRLGEYGWYDGNSGGRTHPVGQKRPNTWGLYDMHGNVLEWVADWYGDYPRGSVTDPRGPSSGATRVHRGGSWGSNARYCRVANRGRNSPGNRYYYLGFRLARTP